MNELKKKIIEALIDQKEIFGDELYIPSILIKRKTEIQNKNTSTKKSAPNIVKDPEKELFSLKREKIDDAGKSLFGLTGEEWESAKSLDSLNKQICECQKCPLGATRNKFVFGVGNPNADVMCIGEGPGADEDAKGEPFVGRAGQLLTDILKAINFSREEVYIANIVKCRPPGNRAPNTDEMDACIPYLKKQIDLIKPKLILLLGLTAAQGLLKKRDSLTNMRGKLFEYEGIKVMVTYHPAALLRNPNWKRPCWEDVQKFRKLYDSLT